MTDYLGRLRRRLTLWYAVTLGTIVLALGAGLFIVIREQIAAQLDGSLRGAAAAVERATSIRETERAEAQGPVVDAVAELRIQDRTLYLLDADGTPIIPATAPEWIRATAARALRDSATFATATTQGDRSLRAYAARFRSKGGHEYVAVAAADRIEVEDQYAELIGAFGAAALIALLLFAAGGSFLTRKSIEPVALTMDSMRRFMADAAHELRTPLTVLRSRAEVELQRADANPAVDAESHRAALVAIEREAARLGKIVEDLLLLARSDAGAWPVTPEHVYLDDIASDAVSAALPLAERGGVSLTLTHFDEAPVEGDPALLHQLLVIILDNAIKFTPAGGSVEVSVTHDDGDGSRVRVTDTGAGVPPEQAAHVFERFFRGDAARGRSTGAGLGLSIAQWIASVHRATIDFQSEPGHGTIVGVHFPPARATAARAAVSSP